MLFAYLVLAVATALCLARPAKMPWLRWAVGLLVIAALAQDAPTMPVIPNSTVPAFVASGRYRSHLKAGETVVVVSQIGNAGMLWQADTDFYMRIDGGYINQAINTRTDLPKQVQNLAHATPQLVAQFEAYIRHRESGRSCSTCAMSHCGSASSEGRIARLQSAASSCTRRTAASPASASQSQIGPPHPLVASGGTATAGSSTSS